MKELPDDFDWVTARGKCSAAVVYETLLGLATANVSSRNAQGEQEAKRERFRLTDSAAVGRGFMVTDTWGDQRRMVAVEVVERDSAIRVRSTVVKEETVYSLSLNDQGECRLTAGGLALQPWQVLRRALETLFYSQPEY